MAVEITTLQLDARLTNAEQTISQLQQIRQHGDGAGDSFSSLAKRIAGFSTVADLAVRAGQALLRGIKDLAVESVTLAAGFEKSRMTWGVLVQDMDKGNKVFEELYQFAAKTPLSFQGTEHAAQVLKGMGVAAEDLIGVMGRLGDVAMGDDAKLQRVSLVYGQVVAKGKADTRDLWQFVDAGVPIVDMLAKTMKITGGEVLKLTADSKVGFAQVQEAIRAATDEGGQFYGLMDKVALTTSGRWSTAMDNMRLILADIGEQVLPTLNSALEVFNDRIMVAIEKQMELSRAWFGTGKGAGSPERAAKDYELAQARIAEIQARIKAGVPLEIEAALKSALAGWEVQIEILREQMRTGNAGARATAPAVSAVPKAEAWETNLLAATEGKWSSADKMVADLSARAAKEAAAIRLFGGDVSKAYYKAAKELEEAGLALSVAGNPQTAETLRQGMVTLRIRGGEPAKFTSTSDAWRRYQERNENTPMAPGGDYFLAGKLDESTQAAKDYQSALASIYESYDRLTLAELAIEDSLTGIQSAMAGFATEGFLASFESIGAALVDSADGAETFKESMEDLGSTILDQMPRLLFMAGVNLLGTPGGMISGLSLIGMSGITAITAGAIKQYSSSRESALGDVYSQHGPAFGWEGARAFAQGSVFANTVVTSPTFFRAKDGAPGVMGEAGPEAIVPVKRSGGGYMLTAADGATQFRLTRSVGGALTVDPKPVNYVARFSGAMPALPSVLGKAVSYAAFAQGGIPSFAEPRVFASGGVPGYEGRSERSGSTSSAPTVVNVEIVNETGQPVKAEKSVSEGANGEKNVRLILRKAVQEDIASGALDGVMAGRYGARPRGARK